MSAANRRQELLDRYLRGAVSDVIEPVRRDQPLALSPAQQRLWLLDQLQPGGIEYLVTCGWRLHGPLDVSALHAVWQEIVARHEVLRTRYVVVDGEPAQVVDPVGSVDVQFTTLTAEEEASKPFDLGSDAPLRVRLRKVSDDEHTMMVVVHHIAFDGFSAGVIAREFDVLYPAFVAGQESPLAPLALQYADFAAWQRKQAVKLDYWRDRLAGLTPLELTTDRPRPPLRDPRGATQSFEVPAELAASLAKLGRARGATPFMVLLAAFQVLLSRYTGQSDIAVGTPVAGRTRAESRDLVGLFVNTLVMRNQIDDSSFVDLLSRVRRTALDAYAHQDIPFERLVNELAPERDPSRNPLVQTMFVMQNTERAVFGGAGLSAEPMPTPWLSAKFDLTMYLTEEPDGSLAGVLEYATALFDRPTITRICDHFCQLLASIVESPDAPVTGLELLTVRDNELLAMWNDTSIAYPTGVCLHELVEDQVRRTPQAIAVIADGVQLTYADLNKRANRLANGLIAQGVGPESVVGVRLHRSIDLVVALLAVVKAGAAYLPLDPDYPADRLDYMTADSGAQIVLTDCTLGDGQPAVLSTTAVTPDNPAYVIYTSGSTGRPKGVVVGHRGIVNRIQWMQDTYRLDTSDRVIQKTPYSFDVSVWEFFWTLSTGATLVMAKPGGHLEPNYLARLIRDEHVTTVHFVPSMLRTFLTLNKEPLPSLRRVLCSGEALPADLVTQFESQVGCELHNLYGPTEASVDVTATQCHAGEPVTIGRPIANTQVYVVDSSLRQLPVGVPGELLLAGVQLARGYLGKPGLTADRFVPNPFMDAPGARLYRTGDLVRRLPDGTIDYLGRIDHQVKIHGVRMELGEIESVLVEHPRVGAAVVVVRETNTGPLLVGYLTPAGSTAPEVADLRAYLGKSLPPPMIPTKWVVLDELPLTSSGKIDRKALPAPERRQQRTGRPSTPVERDIARAFAEAIGVDAIGTQDKFFTVGGDSMRAIRAVGALRELGMDISVQQVFLHQTVAELARVVGTARTEQQHGVDRFALIDASDHDRLPDVVDAYPLSMVQAGMAYEMIADPDRGRYLNTLSYPIRDDGPFSLSALKAAAQLLVDRHEVLRTSIDVTTFREPLQLVHRAATMEVRYEDLTGREPGAFDEFLERAKVEPWQQDQPPLLRLHAHQFGEREWRLTMCYHHTILDGWSQNSLVSELLEHYQAIRAGQTPEAVEPPAVRFADAIALERVAVKSEVDEQYWSDRVTAYDRLSIPDTWADEGPARFQVARVPIDDLVPRLRGIARKSGLPLKSFVLAAHLTALGALTGQSRFHTGLVSNVRPEQAGGDQVRGMFLNTVPISVRLEVASWSELAQAVFDEETAMWPHRRYPLPAMQKHWGGQRPLVEVFFNHTDMRMLESGLIELSGIIDNTPNEFGLSVSTAHRILVLEAFTDRIGEQHFDLLTRTYRHVLEQLVENPGGDPRACGLPDIERNALLHKWNDTSADIPGRALPDLIAWHVADQPAVVSGSQSLTYRELNARSNQLAHHLRQSGIGQGSVVGVSLDRTADLVVALIGVLRSGAAYLPLNPVHPAKRIEFMLTDAAVSTVITQQDLEKTAACPTTSVPRTVDGDSLAYVMYTSGSTGTPKGVMVTHRGLTTFLTSMLDRPGLAAGATVLATTTVSFDVSALELYLPLLVGGRVVVASTDQAQDPHQVSDLIKRCAPAAIQATPAVLRTLVDSGWSAPKELTVLSGGEQLPADLAKTLTAGGSTVWDLYGPTETTVWSSTGLLDGHGKVVDWAPVTNTTVHVLDGRLEPVPIGVAGEVYIGGDCLARGYVGRPGLTADRFIPDPHTDRPGGRLYRTGDLARRHPDGRVEILGRADHQVKIRGQRIEPAEIEAALLAHKDISAAVVQPTKNAAGQYQLTAYLVVSAPIEDLRTFLGGTLPDAMIPTSFVELDALPLNSSGKIDRNALPDPEEPSDAPEFVGPRTDTERTVAEAWADVLGRDRVGVHEDFFDIGGHSLAATGISVRLREAFGVDVPVRALFRHSTVATLAAALPSYASLEV